MNTRNVVCRNSEECQRGKKYLCVTEILEGLDLGFRVFMLHSHHVRAKLESIGDFNFDLVYQNEVPTGMYITKK